jgi:hypothetical protein
MRITTTRALTVALSAAAAFLLASGANAARGGKNAAVEKCVTYAQ